MNGCCEWAAIVLKYGTYDMSHERTFNRYFLKKIEPAQAENSNARGRNNERRALVLLRELVDEGVFVRVKTASKKQKIRGGIDIFGIAPLEVDGQLQEVPIPFQIKSSFTYAQECLERNSRDPERQMIEIITVNDRRPDGFIKDIVRMRVRIFLAAWRKREIGLEKLVSKS